MSTAPPANAATNPAGQSAPSALANLDELIDVEDLARVLVVLEDFLLHADSYIVDELAGYPLTRPDDPQGWVRWIADLLGEHVITLRALIPTATATTAALPAHQMIGETR
jgi:hypothetical protein